MFWFQRHGVLCFTAAQNYPGSLTHAHTHTHTLTHSHTHTHTHTQTLSPVHHGLSGLSSTSILTHSLKSHFCIFLKKTHTHTRTHTHLTLTSALYFTSTTSSIL